MDEEIKLMYKKWKKMAMPEGRRRESPLEEQHPTIRTDSNCKNAETGIHQMARPT